MSVRMFVVFTVYIYISSYYIHNGYFTVLRQLRVYENRWKNAAGGRIRVLAPETKSRLAALQVRCRNIYYHAEVRESNQLQLNKKNRYSFHFSQWCENSSFFSNLKR